MTTHRGSALGIALAAMMLLLQQCVVAQDEPQGQGQDPPSRVARLNYSEGSVSFQPGGEGDWVQAVANRPLTTGDNLWADKDSRAELHVGSTAMRLGSESSLTFLDLDDQTTQLKLSQGSLILRVRHLDDGDNFEVDTPNLAFVIQRTGEYRIDVNGDGSETDTTVWHGRGEVTGGGSTYMVVAGQYARFSGADQLNHDIEQIPGSDDFDNWAFSRDEREDHSESANYISPEMTGSEDLDDNGNWHYVADYGPVWTPRGVAADWAPYRDGHWAWVDPWGWTWIEDEPWGFAPFHYGRWAYVSNSWCWVPGPVVVRPVYAPALVAFVGGGGFSVGIGIGGGVGVGWFPLAPREVYVPWYRTSPRYVNNVNITNTRVSVTQVTNVYNTTINNNSNVTRVTYVNQHVNNATTVVSHDTFVNARPVHQNAVRVDARQIEQAQVVRAAPVQPVRASVLGAGAPARFRPPATTVNRQVVATRNPTPPKQSFEQRQTANVRTETPGTPQPATRMGNEPNRPNAMPPNQGRPQQPAVRANEAPQPAPHENVAPRPQNEVQHPQEPPPNAQTRNVPQPATRENAPPQPQNELQHPQQPAPNVQTRNVPRPPNNVRPETPQNQQPNAQPQSAQQQNAARPQGNPRPETPRPETPQNNRAMEAQPANAYHPPTRAQEQPLPPMNERPQQQPTHPLVRQAPPVQDRPEQQRNEEQKFNTWNQQHQAAAPREAPRPPEQRAQPQERQQPQRATPPPKNEKPKPN